MKTFSYDIKIRSGHNVCFFLDKKTTKLRYQKGKVIHILSAAHSVVCLHLAALLKTALR